jgi:hypothetical protein
MKTRREWERSSWTQPTGRERIQLIALRSFLADQLAAAAGGERVTIEAEALRAALRDTTPGEGVNGAVIKDKQRGVTYRVTLDSRPRSPGLRSVDVSTKAATIDPLALRIPVQALVSQALAVRDQEANMANEDGAPGVVIGRRRLAPPTPTELWKLRQTKTVEQIAEMYERQPRMVYEWLKAAREASPKLNWPEPNPGPTPKTPDDKKSPGQPKK